MLSEPRTYQVHLPMDLDFEIQLLDNTFDVGTLEYLEQHELDKLDPSDFDLAIPKPILKR